MGSDANLVSGVDPFGLPLRVLHLAQPRDGGVAGYVVSAAAYQAQHGWSVTVAGDFPLPAVPGLTHQRWNSRRNPARGLRAEAARLREILDRARPQVVVLHSAKAGVVGRLTVRARIPTVYVPHAWSFYALPSALAPMGVAWERVAARWANAVVAVSDREAADGVRRHIGAPMFVVANPAPDVRAPDGADRGALRARLGIPDGPTVVCVGRLSRQKGQDVLLQAWPRVRAAVPDASLVLVGGGQLQAELSRAAPAGVMAVGASDEPLSYLAGADLVVLPSRWEGMSLAMLEALALGRSVVMSDVGGSEVVRAADAGAVVPVEDVNALADALITRLRDPVATSAEGARGAAFVRNRHSFEAAMTELAAVVARAYAFGRTV